MSIWYCLRLLWKTEMSATIILMCFQAKVTKYNILLRKVLIAKIYFRRKQRKVSHTRKWRFLQQSLLECKKYVLFPGTKDKKAGRINVWKRSTHSNSLPSSSLLWAKKPSLGWPLSSLLCKLNMDSELTIKDAICTNNWIFDNNCVLSIKQLFNCKQ